MTLTAHQPLQPGTWVSRAQETLDALSTMTTVEDVVATFGSARTIVEAILGTPVTGGTGTRRAIRATGRLLTHRLSPALAVEALSWAASFAEAVDPSTVETFLEEAAASQVVHRPRRLEDRHDLLSHLQRCSTERARRQTLRRLWAWHPPEVQSYLTYPAHRSAFDADTTWLGMDGDVTSAELEAWLVASSDGPLPAHRSPSPRIADLYLAIAEDGQVEIFGRLSDWQQRIVAGAELLFDLAEPIVAHCLDEHTGLVLVNPGCPPALRERIRHPYDSATLELALRAGPRHFEAARVRRMISQLSEAQRSELHAAMPVGYLTALRACGLNTAEALLRGSLADVDLSDSSTARAILGTADDWHRRRVPDDVAEVLIHHPQACHLTWTLVGQESGRAMPDIAQRLVHEACDEIAELAIRHLPHTDLTDEAAEVARRSGPYWAARCPGISAADRPDRDLFETWRDPALTDEHVEAYDYDGRFLQCRPRNRPFDYPAVIQRLERPHQQAPGWSVWLPRTPDDLVANGAIMRNCTASYTESIHAGSTFILLVEDPRGRRYNVAVHRRGSTYRVGQINSWANEGIEPAWIRPTINALLAADVLAPEPTEPPLPPRRPSSRRDRRRARATRSRRLRR